MERLRHERALALGEALDISTWKNYGSALNSYLNFVFLHDLSPEPTADRLSLFTVWTSFYIEPRSVDSYLSGICSQLEPNFPDIRKPRSSPLVKRTLRGCERLRSKPVRRKRALTLDDLARVIAHFAGSTLHDDLLFVAMLLTGFFALMRLGELSFPDDKSLWDWCKVIRRDTVRVCLDMYEFHLPHHKADRYFEGNRIIIQKDQFRHNPLSHFIAFLRSRDRLFPLSSPLWIMANGHVPTRSFFTSRLRRFFDASVAGQSMRAGGDTSLAEHGTPPSIIQALGRWSSQAFIIYIRKNPALIQAMLYSDCSERAHRASPSPRPVSRRSRSRSPLRSRFSS
ncbi:hypothetical protein M413DRAFT_31273 [Hebeloma cylindrosporum]|uniref:Tyr recombinase domain-containing protein n=1 Tax=Hebeloma cylindrosporum TaxID=76867 RepID=A0A0C3BXT0_HEBCY|nr:hypothetical protein M413DRAFT_31273 [Hebeloma cylindrosporum h7]